MKKQVANIAESISCRSGIYLLDARIIIHGGGSTGIIYSDTYWYDRANKTWKSENKANKMGLQDAQISRNTEEILNEVQIGTRITITNLQAFEGSVETDDDGNITNYEPGDPFRNENFIKVGNDQYVAGYLDGGPVYTLEQLKFNLATHTDSNPSEDYINTNIYVSNINIIENPEK